MRAYTRVTPLDHVISVLTTSPSLLDSTLELSTHKCRGGFLILRPHLVRTVPEGYSVESD